MNGCPGWDDLCGCEGAKHELESMDQRSGHCHRDFTNCDARNEES